MRDALIAMCLLLAAVPPAAAQLNIGIGVPGVSIGIEVPMYPRLARVPNYPVYYAPGLNTNYFFYDGMYWVYQRDNWYASSWYNGPWGMVDAQAVPAYVLRVPVRYYRAPPSYFRGWRADAPPRWGEHWGSDWQQHRGGWDRWDRRAAPVPAPLPTYQRKYPTSRYPQAEQQQSIHRENYRYQPRQGHERDQPHRRVPAPPAGGVGAF
jgi:hypothetical protein